MTTPPPADVNVDAPVDARVDAHVDAPVDVAATDLVISRLLPAPRAALWRAWTDPTSLPVWWCPRPWTTELRAFDLRPGGAFHTVMRGPDEGISDNAGCFLEP